MRDSTLVFTSIQRAPLGSLRPNKTDRNGDEPPLKFRRPPSVHFADGRGAGAWNWTNFAGAPAQQLEQWVAEEMPAMNLMTVTDSMPEGTAIVDCGAALDCMGDAAAAKTAQALAASGETRLPEIVDKEQTFKFGGDGGPKKANFAVIFPVTIGDTPTWIEAFVIEGNTPHLVSRRWLSKHKCLMCFDPENLYLESPEFWPGSLDLAQLRAPVVESDRQVKGFCGCALCPPRCGWTSTRHGRSTSL